MNKTKIEWTDFSANPIKFRDTEGRAAWGCIKASAGCQNCYAEAISRRYRGPGAGFTAKRMEGLTPYVDEAELKAMLSPRRLPAGSKCFLGDMTDVFGEWVSFGLLFRVFRTIWSRPDVTFQILTKRPERMRKFFEMWDDLEGEDFDFHDARGPAEVRKHHPSGRGEIFAQYVEPLGEPPPGAAYPTFDWIEGPRRWPRSTAYDHVWLGTSVEDQHWADIRLPELLACPAAVRFISFEPLLGPVDLTTIRHGNDNDLPVLGTQWGPDWVIVGGESGPGARPCDIGWIRSIVEQCKAAGVACFVKQLGGRPYNGANVFGECAVTAIPLRDRKGGALDEWPEDLRVREMPNA